MPDLTQAQPARRDTGNASGNPGSRLRGGVVGFGRMGLTHFAILNTHPRVEFRGICDASQFMRRNVTKYLGVQAFADYNEMLDSVPLDFLIVATPTGAHAEVVGRALERGLHVFVEKPLALASSDGQRLVEAAIRANVVHQVGYVVRFNDVVMQVKGLLDAGALGELIHYKMEMYGPTVLREPTSWRGKKAEGGGCLYDFASHSIDLTNHLFGVRATPSGTVLQRIYSSAVEDAVYTTLVYENGLRGSLLANWSDPAFRKPSYRLEILGREGKLTADLHAYKVYFRGTPAVPGFETGWNTRYVTDFAQPVRFYLRGYEFTRQLDYFIDCILERREASACSFSEGLATDRLMESIAADGMRTEAAHG
jgi:predicted dehydrogenase